MYWKQKEPLALYFSIIQCLHNESTMRVSFPRQSRIARVLLRTFKWNYKFIRKYRELLQYPFHYGWNWKKKKHLSSWPQSMTNATEQNCLKSKMPLIIKIIFFFFETSVFTCRKNLKISFQKISTSQK